MRISDWSSDVCSSDLEWLHLVDLNGAVEGHPVNGEAVSRILDAMTIPVQLGGGIRDMATIEMWLQKGVRRDRKSVVSGKSVSGRVDLGGRRIIKKKQKVQTIA